MFRRKGGRSLAFHREKIIGWLSLLAGKMREHSQSVFLIEGLQPSWLGTRTKRVAFGTIVALSLGSIYVLTCVLTCVLTGGLIGGLVGELSSGLAVGLIGGLIGGLSISVGAVFGCWSESPLRNGIISGSIGGLMTAMICGLTVGPRASLTFAPTKDVATHVATGGLIAVLTVGLNAGLMGGLIAGAVGGLGIGPLNQITLVESISWKWNQFWKRTIPGS